MLDALNNACLAVADLLLGWLLHFPRDAALIVVAFGTGLVLTVVRVFTTNQDLLRRCKQDKKRQKQLLRQAKKARDREARNRHRLTIREIGLKAARQEGWPLLASIVPVALLAVWAFGRIAYRVPDPWQGVELKMYFPPEALGGYVHLMPPEEGLTVDGGLIRRIVEDDPPVAGVAGWALSAQKRPEPYRLRIRAGGRIVEHELRADGRRYVGPFTAYGSAPEEVFEYVLSEHKYRPFGLIGDWNVRVPEWTIGRWTVFGPYAGQALFTLDAWLIGYLLLAIPFAFILRPVLRIC
ncbi:MAG: hypothetical protein GXY85_12845 [Candidatus Brocadiaceae bacterium]|nr:hypothetical protein [Candidatus Brocadiaceae bacterium]